nr:uncharacterized protein LOC113728902 [Coffea arabica]
MRTKKVKDLLVDEECVGVEVVNRVAGIWMLLAGNALLEIGNARGREKVANRVNWNLAAPIYRERNGGETRYGDRRDATTENTRTPLPNVSTVPEVAAAERCDDGLPRGRGIDQHKYASIIGSLIYAIDCIRPDIAYAVNILGRFTSKPSYDHWNAIVHVMKYLKGTINYGLHYKNYLAILEGFNDANLNSQSGDSLSTTVYIFILGGATVCWRSKKQHIIAKSAMEAELIALASVGEEIKGKQQQRFGLLYPRGGALDLLHQLKENTWYQNLVSLQESMAVDTRSQDSKKLEENMLALLREQREQFEREMAALKSLVLELHSQRSPYVTNSSGTDWHTNQNRGYQALTKFSRMDFSKFFSEDFSG